MTERLNFGAAKLEIIAHTIEGVWDGEISLTSFDVRPITAADAAEAIPSASTVVFDYVLVIYVSP